MSVVLIHVPWPNHVTGTHAAQHVYLFVDLFFVLSGFLITSLLVGEWRQTLTIKLGAFWARRARRAWP